MLQSMGPQRVAHDLATEQQQPGPAALPPAPAVRTTLLNFSVVRISDRSPASFQQLLWKR